MRSSGLMKILDITLMSLEGLIDRKGRVALNVLGILIGCAAITGLISLADGMNNQVQDQLSIIGTNSLFVIPEEAREAASTLSGSQILSQNGISWRDREIIIKSPEVELISEISYGGGQYSVKGEIYDTKILGVGDNFLNLNKDIAIESGRFFRRGDRYAIVIGNTIAHPSDKNEQVLDIGDRLKLSVRVKGETKEVTLRVVGVFEEHGTMFGLNVDDSLVMPFRTINQLFEQGGSCAVVQVYIEDSDNMDTVEMRLEEQLGDDYYVVSPDAAIDVQKQITGTIQNVLGGIAGISMLVAGIGIVNTMTISVSERTREIGILKAIGAKSVDVLLLFLSEAFYTGIIGGIIGSALGFTISTLVGEYIGLPIILNTILVLQTIAFALITSLISGASPAWNAANMSPVEALRKE